MRRNRSAHSPAYKHFVANYKEYDDRFAREGRVDWIALADEFKQQGLVNAEGEAASKDCIRLTWWRVQKALGTPAACKRPAGGGHTARVRLPDEPFSSRSTDNLRRSNSASDDEPTDGQPVLELRRAKLK